MIEHVKSALLVLLVAASLAQTGILWYSSPSYEESRQNDYFSPPQIGSEKYRKQVVSQLAAPREFILHQEGYQQQILPNHDQDNYQSLMEKLKYAIIENLEEIHPTPTQWKRLLKDNTGLELRFHNSISAETTDTFFSSNVDLNMDTISRLWFFEEAKTGKTYAWFISDQEERVIQGSLELSAFRDWIKTMEQLDGHEVETVLADGSNQLDKKAEKVPEIFYLPTEPLQTERYTFRLKLIKAEDMKQALFPDPDLAKRNLVLDNSYIYTDGRSNLQHNTEFESMIYNDPVSNSTSDTTVAEDLEVINQFMNRHSGWTGNYLLEMSDEDKNSGLPVYTFRLFVGDYPVYWTKKNDKSPSTIRLSSTGKRVATYQRSLHYLSTNSKQEKDELASKKELLNHLKKEGLTLSDLRSLHPGYRAVPHSDQVELIPTWVAEKKDGNRSFIDTEEDADGLE